MIKRLLKSVREFKKDALLTPFFVVLEVVMEVVFPAVTWVRFGNTVSS